MKNWSELFDPEPSEWGLRGDPWVWRALREHLGETYLPPSTVEVTAMLFNAFDRIVSVDLNTDIERSVYRAEFATGDGPSSGYISLEVWRDRLIPLLVDRADSIL